MEPKFKIGDRVLVKWDNRHHNGACWVSTMNKYDNKEFTIIAMDNTLFEHCNYLLDGGVNPGGGCFNFAEDWLHPVEVREKVASSIVKIKGSKMDFIMRDV